MTMHSTVCSGAEVLQKNAAENKKRRVGLITNPTAVTRTLRPTYDILAEKYNLAAMFSPEHGVRGDIQAGAEVSDYIDSATGIPVYSLFGKGKSRSYEIMSALDHVYFDICDIGSRYYTFQYTMTEAMQICAEHGVPFTVLDRPPVIGYRAGGNILDPRFSSFVGKYPTAARTGLSIGEFAMYINKTDKIGCDLTVIGCENVRRDMYFEETGLPFVPPSPNIPTVDTALVYVGTCLFEGTNLSEGRGTTKPFEQIGAPWLKNRDVIAEMNTLPHDGCIFRETYFVPTFSKHSGELCSGIQLHITDRDSFMPFETALRLICAIRRHCPEFCFSSFITSLFGSDAILNESFDAEEYIGSYADPLERYKKAIRGCFIY